MWDDIWAEDARYFYSNARAHPWHSTLFEPLAGYLQLVPRFWSIIAAQFPIADAALLISLSAALSAALLSVYVFVASRDVLPQLWQRCAIAILLVLHPAASYEVNAALNNVHWFLMFAAFWACLSTASTRGRTAIDVAVVALSALSDALTVLWLPLVAIRAWRGRGSARWTAPTLLACFLLQYVVAVHGATPQHQPKNLRDIPEVYAFRVFGSLLTGEKGNQRLFDAHAGAWVVVATLIAAVVLAGGFVLLRPRQRVVLALALTYSAVFLLAPLVLRGGASLYLVRPVGYIGSRYVILPLFLGYTALIVAAGGLGDGLLRWRARRSTASGPPTRAVALAVPSLVLLLIGAQIATNYAASGARTSSGSWRQAVASAKIACEQGNVGVRVPSTLPTRAQPFLHDPGIVWLPVSPWANNWPARFQCAQL